MLRHVKKVKIKDLEYGAGEVYVQSMLNKPDTDVLGNVTQAVELEQIGCQLVRVAIPNMEAVRLIQKIKEKINIPLVADIHFDYKLALESIEAGIDKIRINPGNIGDEEKVRAVANACARKNVPIRIGVNSGSVEKEILAKYGAPTAQALAESAMSHVKILERHDFDKIIVSIKSSDVTTMIRANEILAETCDYPLHLGVTEAGTKRLGIMKSAIGIGSLLSKGIGETIRVSLTDDPKEEIKAAFDILRALDLKRDTPMLISCPTCGRTKINLISLANQVEEKLMNVKKDIKVAVMGCAVNGPGEAAHADIGIAGGVGSAVLFKKGVIVRRIDEADIVDVLLNEIEKM